MRVERRIRKVGKSWVHLWVEDGLTSASAW